jgi:fatty-acyl-CoA synthase
MMLHPRTHAEGAPDRPALVMGSTGLTTTYGELERRANQAAHLFRNAGLGPGDALAIVMENHPRYLEVAWAAQRTGLRYTAVNSHLTAGEIQYILDDSGAKALVASSGVSDALAGLDLSRIRARFVVDGILTGFESYEDQVSAALETPVSDEMEGTEMLYSSGTTGRPKGVRKSLPATPLGDLSARGVQIAQGWARGYGMDPGDVYLCPAPLYHAAPLLACMCAHRIGATIVLMESFDPERCLQLIELHRVSHAQFVPTMFVRMLKLPKEVRDGYDISSLRVAIHAAAPCPVAVKEQLMAWWGPIVYEYYAGTEDIGGTSIGPDEWLNHRGSVGRPRDESQVHVIGPDGDECLPGIPGSVYFSGHNSAFEYHNDPEKTKAVFNDRGWRTLGDIGYLDSDGYLYLTDRKAYMIVSGGVNIYPQEAENVLALHPAVADAAVIGVPNAEFGEEVKAVVELVEPGRDGPGLESELIRYCRERLAAYKCPRTVDFVDDLPRDPNGKLYKRLLRDRYWAGHDSRII